jgi:hypothetical protein
MAKTKKLIYFIVLGITILFSMPAFAIEIDGSIANCLKAWGKHPFGNNPNYKTLATSVKSFKTLPIQKLPIRRLWSWLILGSTSWVDQRLNF